jgi:hypothetical protein
MLFGVSLFLYLTIGHNNRLAFDLDLLDFSPPASTAHFSKHWLQAQAAQARSQGAGANYHPGISSLAIESVDPFR